MEETPKEEVSEEKTPGEGEETPTGEAEVTVSEATSSEKILEEAASIGPPMPLEETEETSEGERQEISEEDVETLEKEIPPAKEPPAEKQEVTEEEPAPKVIPENCPQCDEALGLHIPLGEDGKCSKCGYTA